jgi:hypothetical protein
MTSAGVFQYTGVTVLHNMHVCSTAHHTSKHHVLAEVSPEKGDEDLNDSAENWEAHIYQC